MKRLTVGLGTWFLLMSGLAMADIAPPPAEAPKGDETKASSPTPAPAEGEKKADDTAKKGKKSKSKKGEDTGSNEKAAGGTMK